MTHRKRNRCIGRELIIDCRTCWLLSCWCLIGYLDIHRNGLRRLRGRGRLGRCSLLYDDRGWGLGRRLCDDDGMNDGMMAFLPMLSCDITG
jgi:hypothetical protein